MCRIWGRWTGILLLIVLVMPGLWACGEKQQGESFQFIRVGELVGSRDTTTWKTQIEMPCDTNAIGDAEFCDNCQKRLTVRGGSVLLDLYVPGEPVIYPITDGATYEIRCYTVAVGLDREQNMYRITVTGTFAP